MGQVLASDLDAETARLAQAMVDAIEKGDVDAWGEAFAPGATVWHSYSGAEMTAQDNVEMLRGLLAAVADTIHYEDTRRSRIADGFIDQHRLELHAKTGAHFSIGVCQVMHLTGGRITRMEEYLDSSVVQFGADNAPAGAPQ